MLVVCEGVLVVLVKGVLVVLVRVCVSCACEGVC